LIGIEQLLNIEQLLAIEQLLRTEHMLKHEQMLETKQMLENELMFKIEQAVPEQAGHSHAMFAVGESIVCVQNMVQFTCDCEWLMLSQVSASQRGSEW